MGSARWEAYSEHGEDVRLGRLWASRKRGLYIDVGAAHPIIDSCTYSLYKRGWRGVNVDAAEWYVGMLSKNRPRDINVRCVVRESGGDIVPFYEVVDSPGLSTMEFARAMELEAAGHAIAENVAPTATLTEIWERWSPGEIDVLKIDVEGSEGGVICGCDWEQCRARVIVVEGNQPEEWERVLGCHGYVRILWDGVNVWYVAREEEESLGKLLAGPVREEEYVVVSGGKEAERGGVGWRGVRYSVKQHVIPRALVCLSSSNQMYSGTGRVLVEMLRRWRGEVDITIAIDDGDHRNLEIVRDAARRNGWRIAIGGMEREAAAADNVNREIEGLLQDETWDVVMGVSWANTGTNGRLLRHIGDAALVYVPLFQPTWSVPFDGVTRAEADRVDRRMVGRADRILCLTDWERHMMWKRWPAAAGRCVVVRPGFDRRALHPGAQEREAIVLFVGDLREPRKRFDRVLAVTTELASRGHGVKLVVVGNHSVEGLSGSVMPKGVCAEALGFVDDAELVARYREAAVVMLLSEYEAFGLPIVESLACGTPVIVARQPVAEMEFGGQTGVFLVDGEDRHAAASVVEGLLGANGRRVRAELASDWGRLARRYSWDRAAAGGARAVKAAWANRGRRRGAFRRSGEELAEGREAGVRIGGSASGDGRGCGGTGRSNGAFARLSGATNLAPFWQGRAYSAASRSTTANAGEGVERSTERSDGCDWEETDCS